MAPVSGRTLVFLISFGAGCSLDFTVRSQPADGGSAPDANDASDANPSEDAGSDVAVVDATPDADAAADCTALALEVETNLKNARACVLASGQCMTTVKDQCNCDVVIAVAGSASVAIYEASVTDYKASGCALGCSDAGCPSTGSRNCLQKGGIVECFPP